MKQIEKFALASGREPFQEWLDGLDRRSRARVYACVTRLALGGTKSNVKPVGEGVHEIKIDAGPGYRVYFGFWREKVILLLTGGDKGSQSRDIRLAQIYWREYVSQQIL